MKFKITELFRKFSSVNHLLLTVICVHQFHGMVINTVQEVHLYRPLLSSTKLIALIRSYKDSCTFAGSVSYSICVRKEGKSFLSLPEIKSSLSTRVICSSITSC